MVCDGMEMAWELRQAVADNAAILGHTICKWVEAYDFHANGGRPRTVPLKLLTPEAILFSKLVRGLWEFREFWYQMGVTQSNAPPKPGSEQAIAEYADAWGIKKLVSHVLRSLRLDRMPRDTCLAFGLPLSCQG